MILLGVVPDPTTGTNSVGWFLVSGPVIAHISNGNDVTALINGGVKSAQVTKPLYDAFVASAAALKGTLSGSLGVSGNLTVA